MKAKESNLCNIPYLQFLYLSYFCKALSGLNLIARAFSSLIFRVTKAEFLNGYRFIRPTMVLNALPNFVLKGLINLCFNLVSFLTLRRLRRYVHLLPCYLTKPYCRGVTCFYSLQYLDVTTWLRRLTTFRLLKSLQLT